MPIAVGAKTVINMRQFFGAPRVARLVLFFHTRCVEFTPTCCSGSRRYGPPSDPDLYPNARPWCRGGS